MPRKYNHDHDPGNGRFTGDGDHEGRIGAAVALADEPGQLLTAISQLQDLRREVGDGDAAARVDDAIARLKERAGPKKSAPGAHSVYR